jgi:hypothetical protein
MWMCFAATAVAVGCGGKGAGDDKTGTVQASVASVPGSSSEQPEPGTPAAPTALVRLQFTVKEIDVNIVPIASTGNGDDSEPEDREPQDGSNWVTIAGERQIDLSAGIATDITFDPATIPAGRITQTRLVLEGDAVLWIGSEQATVKCPSCSTSGLKLMSNDDVIIPPGGSVLLKLTFDLGMLGQKHNGSFQLGPVVRVEASALPWTPTLP